MALVYDNLTDCTGAPIPAGLSPTIFFTLSQSAVHIASLVAAEKVATAVPAGNGSFNVNLVPNLETRPLTFYTMHVTWLDSAGNFVKRDEFKWMIRVPPEGGRLRDLIVTDASPYMAYIGSVEPTDSGEGLFWYDPSTGNLYRRTNA